MIYLAYTYDLLPNWRELCEPPARGTMKPETYEARLPELWEKLGNKLASGDLSFLAHRITRAVFRSRTRTDIDSAQAGLHVALGALSGLLEQEYGVVFSIGGHRAIKKMAWQVIQDGYSVLPEVWQDDTGGRPKLIVLDPYMMSGARSHGVELDTWLRAWGEDPAAMRRTDTQLTLLRNLADKMGLA